MHPADSAARKGTRNGDAPPADAASIAGTCHDEEGRKQDDDGDKKRSYGHAGRVDDLQFGLAVK